MDFYLYLHVSEGVPVRKKDEILDLRAGFIVFPRSSLGTFILCASTHWSNSRSMMTVLLISSYIVCRAIHVCTAAFIVHISVY